MAFEQQTTIHLRDDGDLTLIIGEKKQRYVVCRRTITNLCDAWQKMFTNWSEATKPETEWPEDDPNAILIILQIAHLKFDELPETLPPKELNNLAIVCDKYDLVRVVRPFVGGWIQPWLAGAYLMFGYEKFLWVSYVFGYKEEFCTLAKKVQLEIQTDRDAKCITKSGHALDNQQMPPGLLGVCRPYFRPAY